MITAVLGIDPGFGGGCALIAPGTVPQVVAACRMPLMGTLRGRSIDYDKLAMWIDGYAAMTTLAVVEHNSSRPEQGLQSTYQFGYNCGVVAGVIAGCHIPQTSVPPSVWKPTLGVDKEKKLAMAVATKLFKTDLFWPRAVDEGIAEAALIAVYGFRFLNKEAGGTIELPNRVSGDEENGRNTYGFTPVG